MHITLRTPIEQTPRVRQVRGLFDLPGEPESRLVWEAELPLHQRDWNIGLITGPSGCGKTTVARHFFADATWPDSLGGWPAGKAVIDGFPESMSVLAATGRALDRGDRLARGGRVQQPAGVAAAVLGTVHRPTVPV